jgi:ubiquitin carboxyl-terminal hydrolase 34
MSDQAIPITNTERHLLVQHWTRTDSHILTEKLLRIHQNDYATQAILIYLLDCEQQIDFNIRQAILYGIRSGSSTPLSGPFLKAALIYCEHTETEGAIATMIQHIVKVASSVDNVEGKEFLQFFSEVCEISINKSNTPGEDIITFVTESIPVWGPGLLTYYDSSVRQSTEAFIQENLLRYGPHVDFGAADESGKKARTITHTARRLGVACLHFIQDTYIRHRAAAVRATMMNIQIVIEGCAAFFDEDDEDSNDQSFFEQKASKSFDQTPHIESTLIIE